MGLPKKEERKTLYARRVKSVNVDFLQAHYKGKGFSSPGEFVDAIIDQVRKRYEAAKARAKRKARTPVRRNHE